MMYLWRWVNNSYLKSEIVIIEFMDARNDSEKREKVFAQNPWSLI